MSWHFDITLWQILTSVAYLLIYPWHWFWWLLVMDYFTWMGEVCHSTVTLTCFLISFVVHNLQQVSSHGMNIFSHVSSASYKYFTSNQNLSATWVFDSKAVLGNFFCEIILQTYSLGTIFRRESRGVQFPCPCPCRSLLGRPRLFQWQSASWFPPSPRLAQLHWQICPASKTPASGYGVTEASFPSNGGPCAGGGGRHFEPAGKPCSSRVGNRVGNSGTGPVRTEKLGGPGIVHWHKVPPLKAAANSWSS